MANKTLLRVMCPKLSASVQMGKGKLTNGAPMSANNGNILSHSEYAMYYITWHLLFLERM